MPAVQIVAIEVVFENERLGGVRFHKIGSAFMLIQFFEMGLAVIPGINAAELHGSS
jgi:hypothetical protein